MVWRIGNCLWTYLNPPPKLWFINCHYLGRRVTCIHSHVFVLFHPMFAMIWSIYFLTFKVVCSEMIQFLWNLIKLIYIDYKYNGSITLITSMLEIWPQISPNRVFSLHLILQIHIETHNILSSNIWKKVQFSETKLTVDFIFGYLNLIYIPEPEDKWFFSF